MNYCTDAKYNKEIQLLNSDCPSFSGILAGECKGEVWVDNVDHPTLAMVYSHAVGGFSILGYPKDCSVLTEFKDYVTGKLIPTLKNKGFGDFEFSAEHPRTEEQILALFADKEISNEEEYTYRKVCSSGTVEVEGYQIRKVDAEFIRQIMEGKYKNQNFLDTTIKEAWGTYDKFLEKSMAYAAVTGNEIAAVIIGTARYQNIIPIDIQTIEEHRRKGLAGALTQCFVNECVAKGLIAQWDCVESNVASIMTVKKANFEFVRKRIIFWFTI